jgi:adenine-specific DNA-methyltransferase
MKGFVPTPGSTVDLMVERLFRRAIPQPESVILDPGCGNGALVSGVVRWCLDRKLPLPHIVGIECNPQLAETARRTFLRHSTVEINTADFLAAEPAAYDFIICNPPYVPITGLSEREKVQYRSRFQTASGRFDLYLLFFEQALRCLRPGGRLVFITPEKFLYVESARPLRKLLVEKRVEEIRLVDERTFGDLVTYPTITTVVNTRTKNHRTRAIGRDNGTAIVDLPRNGASWLPILSGAGSARREITLEDVCLRVSCGVATGADGVFVRRTAELTAELLCFAHPTVAGRDLSRGMSGFDAQYSMLVPYSEYGQLLDERMLGALRAYLEHPERRSRLMKRTCVRRKPWYAFHETPPLRLILRPKIICKDIAVRPQFWINHRGDLVPRHSVYYIVPKNPDAIETLCEYLNSPMAEKWLISHCQRAANGFLRLQSHILKQLPVPADLAAIIGSVRHHNARTDTAERASRASQLVLPLKASSCTPRSTTSSNRS